jgi:hypothetical protein
MSLRGRAIEQPATLPDGRVAVVWIGVPNDPYIAKRDLDTVALELRVGGEVVAALNTVLDADQESEARELAREIVAGLEAGQLEPRAGDLEPLAETMR